jgi:MULE transposase domain
VNTFNLAFLHTEMDALLEAIDHHGEEHGDDMSDDDVLGAVEEWDIVWDPSSDVTMADFLRTQPKYAIKKTNRVPCTLVHDHESRVFYERHEMTSRLTACTSLRCHFNDDDDYCEARYKINECSVVGHVGKVYKQGYHLSQVRQDAPPDSPRNPTLTPAMKEYIDSALDELPTAAPNKVRENIVLKCRDGTLDGVVPPLKVVQNYVRSWRRSHPITNGNVEVIEGYILPRLFDSTTFADIPDVSPVYVADFELVEVTEGTRRLGNGDTYPFRVGVTCRDLIQKYLNVQRDESKSAIVHIDSTFGVVNASYNFFAFGISDLRGGYHPFAFFCTSQRTAPDIQWCLSQVNQVAQACGDNFNPDYVMMDADDAQFNAARDELNCQILMCWFHVTQNIEKKLKEFRVCKEKSEQVWSDVYDMHYCRSHDQFLDTRDSVLARWTRMGLDDAAMTRFKEHFEREWLLPHSNFWKWQIYHTPKGVPSTNNPLEQYHGKLKKSLHLNKNTTVMGLLEAMEKGLAYSVDADRPGFVNVCEVSIRMKQRYKKMKDLGLLKAERDIGEGNPNFRIKQEGFDEALSRFRRAGNMESAAILTRMGQVNKHKHECFNQPALGWQVNTTRRDCGCNQWFKHGICLHVIYACDIDQKECPGMPRPTRRFVNRSVRVRRRSVRGRGNGQPRRPRGNARPVQARGGGVHRAERRLPSPDI